MALKFRLEEKSSRVAPQPSQFDSQPAEQQALPSELQPAVDLPSIAVVRESVKQLGARLDKARAWLATHPLDVRSPRSNDAEPEQCRGCTEPNHDTCLDKRRLTQLNSEGVQDRWQPITETGERVLRLFGAVRVAHRAGIHILTCAALIERSKTDEEQAELIGEMTGHWCRWDVALESLAEVERGMA